MAPDAGRGGASPAGPPGHAPAAPGRPRCDRGDVHRLRAPLDRLRPGASGHAVRRAARVDPRGRDQLPPRGGWHQPSPGPPDGPPHAALHPVRLDAGHHARQGVSGRDVPARDGDARGLRGPRPLPLLRLLGGHARPDVPDHRGLGWPAPRVRGGEVHPLHDGRLRSDAPGHPDPLLSPGCPHGVVRLRRRDAAPHPPEPPGAALPGLRARLRDQGADGPFPHLAARRPRGGAHRGQRDPGRRAAQDGHLWVPALRPADLSRRGRAPGPRHRDPCPGRHPVRCVGLDGAARHEEAHRLFVGEPPWIRHARALHVHGRRGSRAASSRWSTTASPRARSSSWSA